jgi:hypothetical protein
MGEKRNACMFLVGTPEQKRPLGRLRCKWEYNIKIDLRDKVWGGIDWIHLLTQEGDQWRKSSCEHDNEPFCSIKCLKILK